MNWLMIALGVVSAVGTIWLVLAIALWLVKPADAHVRDYLRLMPDLIRLFKGLAADREVPRRVRLALVAMLAFIASPIDLIPDVIPVIGYSDDIAVMAATLTLIAMHVKSEHKKKAKELWLDWFG